MAQDLILLSHLRWNQGPFRPHQVARYLSRSRRVFYVEEPVHREGREPVLECERLSPNLVVCQPHTPDDCSGFCPSRIPYLESLLKGLLEDYRINAWTAWIDTPRAYPLVRRLSPRAILYDQSGALHATLRRGRSGLDEEAELLEAADLVLVNTPVLCQEQEMRRSDIQCIPDGVDLAHFGRALGATLEPDTQAVIPRPRLGYYGTIDERIDRDLLARIAQARPDWQLILVGQVLDIDLEQVLPQLPNIHYLGRGKFDQLPDFLAGWDLCLLPYADNEASRYLSPTKALEYLAAGRPVVSTHTSSAALQFPDLVRPGRTPAEFIAACDQALREPLSGRRELSAETRAWLEAQGWETVVERMRALLDQCLAAKPAGPRLPEVRLLELVPKPGPKRPRAAPSILILGAGPTGLSAAYHLGEAALVLERERTPGGGYRSQVDNGFVFDQGGHALCPDDPQVSQLVHQLLGDNLHWQLEQGGVFCKGFYTTHPFPDHLYGLPVEVVQECLLGVIERRQGDSSKPPLPGHLESTMALNSQTIPFPNRRDRPRNLEDAIYEEWGAGIARHFLLPFNEKLWKVPLRELDPAALAGVSGSPDVRRMLAGALRPMPRRELDTCWVGYPLKGGFQALVEVLVSHLRGELWLQAEVAAIYPGRRQLVLADDRTLRYQGLISTLPLPRLIELIGDPVPREVLEAARGLRHVSMRCVNLGIGREQLSDRHWIYYPDETLFHRLFLSGNASPYNSVPGGFGLTCEITYTADNPLPCQGEALIERCIQECIRVGILNAGDPVWTANQVDVPYAYVLDDRDRAARVSLIQAWLQRQGLVTAGYFGDWLGASAPHPFVAGRNAAERVRHLAQAAGG